MTVVSMMSFGDSGAAVSDEQATFGGKKDYVSKLRMLGNVICGGSGSLVLFDDIYKIVKESLERSKPAETEEVLNAMLEHLSTLKNKRINLYLKSSYGGIDIANVLTGGISGLKWEDIKEDDTIKRATTLSLLLGGIDEGKFKICFLDSDGTHIKNEQRGYRTIGNSEDEADVILRHFKDSLPRRLREEIPVDKGLVKLIQATNAARSYVDGVGGSPKIIYIKKDGKPKEPSENQCILCSELVNGLDWGYLNSDFVHNAVKRIVIDTAPFEATEQEMIKQAGNKWFEFDHRLRSYKE